MMLMSIIKLQSFMFPALWPYLVGCLHCPSVAGFGVVQSVKPMRPSHWFFVLGAVLGLETWDGSECQSGMDTHHRSDMCEIMSYCLSP